MRSDSYRIETTNSCARDQKMRESGNVSSHRILRMLLLSIQRKNRCNRFTRWYDCTRCRLLLPPHENPPMNPRTILGSLLAGLFLISAAPSADEKPVPAEVLQRLKDSDPEEPPQGAQSLDETGRGRRAACRRTACGLGWRGARRPLIPCASAHQPKVLLEAARRTSSTRTPHPRAW